ncbi:hypothetical protein, partial [Mesorhizobium neociceri]|uniref:hypothetical protein n=1 Tax=Mesorhizobium neociceri TaxID=1307853 RepID=UPI002E2E2FBB
MPVRLQAWVLFGAVVSGSVAVAVYTTVLAGAFSATLAVAPEVTVGASLTSVMLSTTALLAISPPPSV